MSFLVNCQTDVIPGNKEEDSSDKRKKSRKDRRSKLEIYHDVLNAIVKESYHGEVKPTRIQFASNTSYDKLIMYFDELETKQMLVKSTLSITEKGQRFLKEYNKIDEFLREIGLDF
jgi:predicted transcriptional regulator